ncbi:hypothetical protein ACED51_00435 [Photobacterium swingsii]|uniref:hypothetical protein n=1 Tax=Photobacterium swingsii TaxID=680026 RepID=UPI00352E4737
MTTHYVASVVNIALVRNASGGSHASCGYREKARAFINSAKGKAIMKRCGFQSWGQHQKNATNKDKQKRKRTLAKKAKRK